MSINNLAMSKLGPMDYRSLITLSVKTRGRSNSLDYDLGSKFIEKIGKVEYHRNPTRLAIVENFNNMNFFDNGLLKQRWENTYPRLLTELDREINGILSFNPKYISNPEEYEEFRNLPKDEQLKIYLRSYINQFNPKGDIILGGSDDDFLSNDSADSHHPNPFPVAVL